MNPWLIDRHNGISYIALYFPPPRAADRGVAAPRARPRPRPRTPAPSPGIPRQQAQREAAPAGGPGHAQFHRGIGGQRQHDALHRLRRARCARSRPVARRMQWPRTSARPETASVASNAAGPARRASPPNRPAPPPRPRRTARPGGALEGAPFQHAIVAIRDARGPAATRRAPAPPPRRQQRPNQGHQEAGRQRSDHDPDLHDGAHVRGDGPARAGGGQRLALRAPIPPIVAVLDTKPPPARPATARRAARTRAARHGRRH